jgi:hypothetical protein
MEQEEALEWASEMGLALEWASEKKMKLLVAEIQNHS